jgi:PPOX class probable F420-dependent enzyme
VEISEALDFVRQHHNGVLAVSRADGKPQLSPVNATVDDSGLVVISSRETAYKVRSLRDRPFASYCAFTDRFYGDWVQIEGPVRIVALPEAMQPLVDYYRSISGEHPDWDEYREAMRTQGKCLIRITPERWSPGRPHQAGLSPGGAPGRAAAGPAASSGQTAERRRIGVSATRRWAAR